MSDNDNFGAHLIIVILGLCLLGIIGTVCYLAADNEPIPALLASLVLTILALLAPSPLSKVKPSVAPVAVVNQDPIPVTDIPTDIPAGRHAADGGPVGADLAVADLTSEV